MSACSVRRATAHLNPLQALYVPLLPVYTSSAPPSPRHRGAHALTSHSTGGHLKNGGWGSAAQAAGRVEGVDAEELVDQAAGHAKHRRTAVVALGVELEGPLLGVGVALPLGAADVARRLVVRL